MEQVPDQSTSSASPSQEVALDPSVPDLEEGMTEVQPVAITMEGFEMATQRAVSKRASAANSRRADGASKRSVYGDAPSVKAGGKTYVFVPGGIASVNANDIRPTTSK